MIKIPNKLEKLNLEELFELLGEVRFGSSILINRSLHELNVFIHKCIFDENSNEYAFVNAYGVVPKQNTEIDRLRMFIILLLLFDYEEELKEIKII